VPESRARAESDVGFLSTESLQESPPSPKETDGEEKDDDAKTEAESTNATDSNPKKKGKRKMLLLRSLILSSKEQRKSKSLPDLEKPHKDAIEESKPKKNKSRRKKKKKKKPKLGQPTISSDGTASNKEEEKVAWKKKGMAALYTEEEKRWIDTQRALKETSGSEQVGASSPLPPLSLQGSTAQNEKARESNSTRKSQGSEAMPKSSPHSPKDREKPGDTSPHSPESPKLDEVEEAELKRRVKEQIEREKKRAAAEAIESFARQEKTASDQGGSGKNSKGDERPNERQRGNRERRGRR